LGPATAGRSVAVVSIYFPALAIDLRRASRALGARLGALAFGTLAVDASYACR